MTARRAAAAAVATIAALAVPSCGSRQDPGPLPTAVPTAVASTATQAACPDPGVVIRIGDVDAAMGLRALTVSMTNCGDRPYQANGYPAVRVLGDDHKPLDVRVAPGTSDITVDPALTAAPRPVTLQPGGTATAVVMWRNLVTDSTVVATTGTYLEIAPTTGAPAQTVTPKGGIDLGNTGKLGVGPWTAASQSEPAQS
ncbi:DUF4232 domain-containing protein [Rugosimonospora africana]|uniref:DUF4232 domain-containing protein n=1 Tax=Rugosimonospora africana TaxID=556532 RepID=A0A8J3QN98_9ACTN|nr:DUF4232 domain-containing protein [Rugosimonospora africana]GIH14133.1 hypothetical protein Raf01_23050 [Rugosimonospora africana]